MVIKWGYIGYNNWSMKIVSSSPYLFYKYKYLFYKQTKMTILEIISRNKIHTGSSIIQNYVLLVLFIELCSTRIHIMFYSYYKTFQAYQKHDFCKREGTYLFKKSTTRLFHQGENSFMNLNTFMMAKVLSVKYGEGRGKFISKFHAISVAVK